MIQLISFLIIMIAIGALIYITEYKNKEKPKAGIKREESLDYFKDYLNLKLYWISIAFIVFLFTFVLPLQQ